MTWTEERLAELKRLRAKGLGSRRIARALGLTPGQVASKIHLLERADHARAYQRARYAMDQIVPVAGRRDYWDESRLTESWANRKARKARP